MGTFQLERVFYHELGHNVAHRLNELYFGYVGVKGLYLYPEGKDGKHGEIELNKPQGYDQAEAQNIPIPADRMPNYLASLCYGCFFQSYYVMKFAGGVSDYEVMEDFHYFFSHKGEGSKDANDRISQIEKSSFASDYCQLSSIEDDYFEGIIESNALDDFMDLSPLDNLEMDRHGHYIADLNKLNTALRRAIERHSADYMQLIKEYKSVFELP